MPYAEQLTNNLTYHRHIVSTMEKHFSDLLKKTDSVMLDLLKLQEENKKLKQENEELQKHYDNSIHTDWIAEASGEDAEYFKDTCCATTLGNMIKENKKLKQEAEEFYDTKNSLEEYVEELEEQVAELSKSKELLGDEYKKNKIEIVKLKGDVGHYKNSALYYWSHGKLGDQDCLSYPENWDECLNATDEDNCDTQALTKKCMEAEQ